jgi:hypothetical protein
VLLAFLCWLTAPATRANAEDLQLVAALPHELTGCVTEAQLQSSYNHALAAYGGESAPVGPTQVAVRDIGRAPDDPTEMQIELLATRRGRVLGQRTLPVRIRDCAALPRALAVVLVLLVHAEPAPAAPAAPERPATGNVSVAAGALVMFGVMQHPALGLQLRAATAGAPWSARLGASALWPQELEVAEGALRWHSFELAADGCFGGPLPRLPALALRVCAGPRVGWMFARSQGFLLQNDSASKALIYLGVAPEAALRLGGGTWLQLAAGVAGALLRPRFVVGLDAGLRERMLDKPSALRAELSLSVAQIF